MKHNVSNNTKDLGLTFQPALCPCYSPEQSQHWPAATLWPTHPQALLHHLRFGNVSAAHAYGPRKHTTPCKQTLVNVLLVNLKLDYFPQQMYINM